MDGINMGGVVKGGLLAGLIINVGEFILNVPLIGAEFDAVVTSMNREPPGQSAIMIFVLMGFALGILAVWLYAAGSLCQRAGYRLRPPNNAGKVPAVASPGGNSSMLL